MSVHTRAEEEDIEVSRRDDDAVTAVSLAETALEEAAKDRGFSQVVSSTFIITVTRSDPAPWPGADDDTDGGTLGTMRATARATFARLTGATPIGGKA